jgi:hypothetical protein
MNWFDLQGLTYLNPCDTSIWYNPSTCNASPLIINLTLITKAAAFSGQIGDLHVSNSPLPLTDHVVLTLTFYPITSLHLVPLPTSAGYNANPKLKDNWQKTFRHLKSFQPTLTDNLNTLITDFDNLI